MKIAGIVCEYNPMHNGHLFHINRTRKNGATHILAVMSGNFVQRGETAVMDKFSRASCALKGCADLVIEIPSVYSLSSAEYHSAANVEIQRCFYRLPKLLRVFLRLIWRKECERERHILLRLPVC